MENERLARVEEKCLRLPIIEEKLDRLIEWRWKMWGVTAAISVVCTGAFELMLAAIRH